MTENKLKVSDLVDFKEADYKLGKSTIKELKELSNEYSNSTDSTDPNELDLIKRKFISHMATLTQVYSKVKAFKGANHSYLEDARKQFKAEAYLKLRDEGVGSTEANTTVYGTEYFKERIELMEKLRQFFVEVDEMHNFFNNVLQYMQQTISIISKDYEFNRYSKS